MDIFNRLGGEFQCVVKTLDHMWCKIFQLSSTKSRLYMFFNVALIGLNRQRFYTTQILIYPNIKPLVYGKLVGDDIPGILEKYMA